MKLVTFKYSYLVKFRLAMSHDCLECWQTHLRSRTHPGRNIPQRYFYREIIKRFTYLKTAPIHYISRGFFSFFYWKVYERHENELFFLLNLPMDRHANNILNFFKKLTKENLTKEEYQRKYINLVSKKKWFLTYPIP